MLEALSRVWPDAPEVYRWLVAHGWAPILAWLNIILVVRMLFWVHNVNKKVVRIEHAALDAADKGRNALVQVSETKTEVRRMTGKFTSADFGLPETPAVEGNADNTLVRGKKKKR